jgi:hypothetical protein
MPWDLLGIVAWEWKLAFKAYGTYLVGTRAVWVWDSAAWSKLSSRQVGTQGSVAWISFFMGATIAT